MLRNFSPRSIDLMPRELKKNLPEVIAITSGKGGVGKSSIGVNLAILLSQMKRKVLLIDADVHLGNVDLIMGIRAKYTIADVVKDSIDISKALIKAPGDFDILPASSAVTELFKMEDSMIYKLANAFSKIEYDYDIVLLDTGAGISHLVTSFIFGSDKVLLVVTPDPSSIADAYAVIKVIKKTNSLMPVLMIANMVKSYDEGEILYKKMNLMVQKFLNCDIDFGGSLLKDEIISKSVQMQTPFVIKNPNSAATKTLNLLKGKILKLPLIDVSKRNNFFSKFINGRNVSHELNV